MSSIRATLRAMVANAAVDALPDLLAELEGAKALAWTRLVAAPALSGPVSDDVPLPADEASTRTGAPASWLLDAARRGAIPCVRFGAHVRFRVADVLAAVANNQPLKRRKRREHRTPTPDTTGAPVSRKRSRNAVTTMLPRPSAENGAPNYPEASA